MIKVLMVGNHPSNKGGMTSVINQIRDHDWEKDGVELKFVPTYMPGGKAKTILYFIAAYVRVFFFFLFQRPDVFYAHMSVRGSFSRTNALHKLCRLFKIKDVIHLHGSEFEQWYESESDDKKRKIRRLTEESGAFIVLGRKWERFVKKIAPKADIVQIHNCIAVPDEVVSWNGDNIRFLFLGVLIPRKGTEDLLRAVSMLAGTGEIGSCRFAVAGTGPEEDKLKKYVKENSLEKYVEFTGWVSGKEKDREIRNSNVFILPSYNEGLPVAVLEAMSFGLPVISTNVGDIADAVREGVNGYLVDPGDVDSLADRIKRVTDKSEWERLSAASKELARTEFNIEGFYNALSRLWKGVVK